MTTVSVIVPVYNGAAYIESAIRSVAAQTLRPLELLIVDDGSTDRTLEIVERIELPFPKIVLRQHRGYQSAARNLAASRAGGAYLAFLDHDDDWYPRHLEVLVAALEADPRLGWSYSDVDEIDAGGALVALNTLERYAPDVHHPKTDLFTMLASDMFIFPSAAVVRRDAFIAIGGFDERLSGYEDDDLFLRLFRAGWLNWYSPQSLTRYRRHPISSSFSERMWQSREIFSRKLLEAYPDDRNLVRYFVRDIIAPRFFRSALMEYVRHLPHGRWEQCVMSVALMREFRALMRPPTGAKAIGYPLLFWLMARPRAFARCLPLFMRWRRFARLFG